MFPTTLPAPNLPAHAPILARAQAILARLTDHARIVLKTAAQRCAELVDAPLPAPGRPDSQAVPLKCAACAARAIHWAIALSRILAGAVRIAAPRPRAKPLAAQPPKAQPAPKPKRRPAKSQSAARWMRRVFATRSIGYIVTRICYDLGLDYDDDDFWPDELIAITQTPAEYSAMRAAAAGAEPPPAAPRPDSSPPAREAPGQGSAPSNQPATTLPPDDPTSPPAPSTLVKPPPDETIP